MLTSAFFSREHMKKSYAIGIGAVLVIVIIAVIAMIPSGSDDEKAITYDAYCDEVSDRITAAFDQSLA